MRLCSLWYICISIWWSASKLLYCWMVVANSSLLRIIWFYCYCNRSFSRIFSSRRSLSILWLKSNPTILDCILHYLTSRFCNYSSYFSSIILIFRFSSMISLISSSGTPISTCSFTHYSMCINEFAFLLLRLFIQRLDFVKIHRTCRECFIKFAKTTI
jgi:hypothetical protein